MLNTYRKCFMYLDRNFKCIRSKEEKNVETREKLSSNITSCILIGKNYSDAHFLHAYKTCDAQTLQRV